tara:strand:- start:136 stop:420 length:285 start_codon:yes stop_codon:yes gene_type:complete
MSAITLDQWRGAANDQGYGEVEHLIAAAQRAASRESVHPWHRCDRCDAPLLDVAMQSRIRIEVGLETWVAGIIGDRDLCYECCRVEGGRDEGGS